MNSDMINKCGKSFITASLLYQGFERKTHFLQTEKGENLHHTEICVISEIKENKEMYMSALALKYGVTLGAVSQIVKKLEKKGLIKKEKDAYNQSKYRLILTQEGERVHLNHLAFHKAFDEKLAEVFASFSDEEIETICDFMEKLQTVLK